MAPVAAVAMAMAPREERAELLPVGAVVTVAMELITIIQAMAATAARGATPSLAWGAAAAPAAMAAKPLVVPGVMVEMAATTPDQFPTTAETGVAAGMEAMPWAATGATASTAETQAAQEDRASAVSGVKEAVPANRTAPPVATARMEPE